MAFLGIFLRATLSGGVQGLLSTPRDLEKGYPPSLLTFAASPTIVSAENRSKAGLEVQGLPLLLTLHLHRMGVWPG